jgi:thioredoxin-dependent peroxiredoxin
MLSAGQSVPDFSLVSTAGNVSRKSLMGSRYVLYLYPKDDTPGCTKEACGFRDALPKFDARKIKVFGVSADSIKAHEKFISKYQLSFPLIADAERQLIEGLGAWVEKSMYGKKYMGIARCTFVIDSSGKVEKVWDKVSVETHAQDVLSYLLGGGETAKPTSPKAPAKKTVAKATASKTAAAKSAPVTKTAVKKLAANKPAAKKAAKKAPTSTAIKKLAATKKPAKSK